MMLYCTLIQPDDWHLHVREGQAMRDVIKATARCFARAIIMPNLKPPVVNTAAALRYREAILAALPETSEFNPLMTLYLTDNTKTEEIIRAKATQQIYAVKYYPAGATTHSDSGVTNIKQITSVLETLQKIKMPLLIHGEVTDPNIDIFDREAVFIERVLTPLRRDFPELPIVLEHITTKEAAQFVSEQDAFLAATITAHHLLMNRNAIFQGGVRPHHYCLPILKREQHRQALLKAATSGSAKFFLGTDSAPHARHTKENLCGCAGIYSAPAAIELYAEAFASVNALEQLEGFASIYGADFYGLPRNKKTITLERKEWQMADYFQFGEDQVIPLRAGQMIQWQLVNSCN
ncbi:dihydroorotase [Thioflexithrix psekupsensis]|uniref:Dihydroorotase n=1 Tax=Thioflexithrix psekupsensis TaxID=1570016 RepID=A0A251X7A8_9GAMM|nr:dihydroorotase [Thioflexithrix psekupsensis]